MSPEFVHIPLEGGTCCEIPKVYVDVPDTLLRLSRFDPSLWDASAFRAIHALRVTDALRAYGAGDPTPLAALIRNGPGLLLAFPLVVAALAEDIRSRRWQLVETLKGKAKRNKNLYWYGLVEQRRMAKRDLGGGIHTFVGSSGVELARGDDTDDNYFEEVARQEAGVDHTADIGHEGRKGAFAKIKKAVQRLDKIAVRLPQVTVVCDAHLGSSACESISQTTARWDGHVIPTLRQLQEGTVFINDRVPFPFPSVVVAAPPLPPRRST